MRARRARDTDLAEIHALIAQCAEKGLLLPRATAEIRAHIREFLVLVEGNRLAGCVALDSYTSGLAEIRSLAVHPHFRGRGLGGRLLAFALEEAQRRRIAQVFAVTHAAELFVKAGFFLVSRNEIPEKMERDCHVCPRANSCRLVTVKAIILPEANAFPIFRERDALLTPA
jgi:N-acetylglutamate synthase-like GNAT family acetyltransferase